ncbi:hypothetical protein A3H03_02625 [Candidatus Kuenenbacteria bacterium RIFCSPLOWO2_12_FULL_42_13]|uniref:General secretion pathway GspH domain-containing protein n=3 Tax=Candidatus Kueneniibacteriota TaxID=1752740 RepID=A0A0G0YVN9_9BACT|nr:MAG: hypothetical protein UV02_C0038G0001 [Candidatus Kuenenbacteria bacterium GW2011_GWA2_42_15]OGG92200.1 MAG: hypothetical protein A3H03_02625 [Candidatus Kuenenbacteria bacterium RIFCSPLOWO2_12_FULL_42_13]OGG99517.1 MAG: hypothetical protein A3E04_02555 [Candidatus Kuenenbacteria bacterium RIFCSPHIGHO2_12_FULL_42_14]
MSTIKYQKNKPGFTITELVVAAGIIAMISVMVVVNFRGANQKAALDNEAERLSTILRQANINSLIGLTVAGARPVGGFGLHLVTCATDCFYWLFADGDSDHLYNDINPDEDDTLIQRFGTLDDNVYINQIILPLPVGQPQPASLDLVFLPPQGLVFINGATTYSEAQITLGFKNTSYTKVITLDSKSGRINIE